MSRLLESVDDGPPADQADLAFGARATIKNGYSHAVILRPNLYFALQVNLILLIHLLANDLHQLQDIIGGATGMGDNEIGVLFTYFGPADAHALQARLIDQCA